jgi:hypothetical protein
MRVRDICLPGFQTSEKGGESSSPSSTKHNSNLQNNTLVLAQWQHANRLSARYVDEILPIACIFVKMSLVFRVQQIKLLLIGDSGEKLHSGPLA